MKMHVALMTIYTSTNTFTKIYNTSFDTAFKNYKVATFISSIEKHIEFFINERNKLFELYGDLHNDGNIQIRPENIELVNEKLMDLGKLEVEIDELDLNIDDFETCQYPNERSMWLSPKDIHIIETFLKQPNEGDQIE